MLVPHHLTPPPPPPISGEKYMYVPYMISVIGSHWLFFHTAFSELFREIFPRQTPQKCPFPENMGTRMRSLRVFDGGGGGAGPISSPSPSTTF